MGKAPDDIRREIEDTRARMGETVEAIGYRADVPARARESISNTKENIASSVRDAKDRVVGSNVGTKESVVDTASSARGSIADGFSSAGDSISGVGSSFAGSVSDMTPSAEDIRRGARRTVGVAQENPIGLAIGSLALGFLAGMMIPSTKVEQQRLGPIADDVRNKAMETGQEAIERGKHVASEAAHTARQVIDETRSTAQEAAQRGVEDLKSTAQEQGQELASSAQGTAQDLTGSQQPGGASEWNAGGGPGTTGHQGTTPVPANPTQQFPPIPPGPGTGI